MTKARLAALTGVYEYEILEFPVPEAMEGSVVIKVEAASICGSDLRGTKMGVSKPSTRGHEFAGKIVDLGPRANEMIHCFDGELKIGDRIAIYPWISCNSCLPCLTYGPGLAFICENAFTYGGLKLGEGGNPYLNTDPYQAPHFKGGFGEYVHIFPNTFVWKIPDDMPSKIASLLDPTAVAMRAVELAMTESGILHEGISTSTKALIIGAGPIGILAGMILREMGIEQLIISDMVQKKLELAQEISRADIGLNVGGMDSEERIQKIREITHGGANLVINCANHVSACIEGLQMASKLGTFVEVGLANSSGYEVNVDFTKVVFQRNVKVLSVVANYPRTFDRAFRLLKRHKTIPFERLITHEFSTLEDLLPTIKKMGEENYIKGTLVFPESN